METLRTKESLRHLHRKKFDVTSLVVAVHDRPVLNQLQLYVRAAALRWRLSSAEPVYAEPPTASATFATPQNKSNLALLDSPRA